MYESLFLTDSMVSHKAYERALHLGGEALLEALPGRAYSGRDPSELAALVGDFDVPADGDGLEQVLGKVKSVIANSVNVMHPHTAAHLHCPPMIPALAAEVVLTALNQSMDSFDQAPAATIVEQQLTRWLCREAGLPASADGTFTAGATQSNFMGLLFARDAFIARRQHSLPSPLLTRRYRILCSEVAHFSVEKGAAQLGLGADAVIKVAVDENFRLSPVALKQTLGRLQREELFPIAIVATAGTTDFGSIDPLAAIAPLAQAAGAWFHVDAAYGGALLFSEKHRGLLAGLDQADSIGMDFHKLLWQPIGCGAFLLRDAAHFDLIKLNAEYLNPEDNEEAGIPDLVTRSLLTTRRFDALKLWVSLQTVGRRRLAAMIDHTVELAQSAAEYIRQSNNLELLNEPTLGCVLFRYLPGNAAADADAINTTIRRRLFDSGTAVIGQTRIAGRRWLKLTCLNPCTEPDHFVDLLDKVEELGRLQEQCAEPRTVEKARQPCTCS
jgi:L-2,4-diaminobutyrate decarboxylase